MVFVLGIERSATTWVSNILDMHPGTELYMEPLSDNISRFGQWPDRFSEIGNLSEKAQYFREEFAYLRKRNKLLFSRLFEADWAWDIDMEVAQKFWKFSPRARDFFELNFHRLRTTDYPPKGENPVCIIKELRLNYNVSVIKEIDSNAKVIVILRNYAANIQSIARQIEQENLAELTRLLQHKYGGTDIKYIFDYWASSYNTLLNDLDETNTDYLLLKQEEFIKSGKETVDQLLEFVGLPPVPSVYHYISSSNKKGSGKHSTNRDHADILEKNRQAEKELYPELATQFNTIKWHRLLRDIITKS